MPALAPAVEDPGTGRSAGRGCRCARRSRAHGRPPLSMVSLIAIAGAASAPSVAQSARPVARGRAALISAGRSEAWRYSFRLPAGRPGVSLTKSLTQTVPSATLKQGRAVAAVGDQPGRPAHGGRPVAAGGRVIAFAAPPEPADPRRVNRSMTRPFLLSFRFSHSKPARQGQSRPACRRRLPGRPRRCRPRRTRTACPRCCLSTRSGRRCRCGCRRCS